MEREEHIQEILNSGLAIGHMFQNILETHGMQDKEARVAARSLAAAVSQQFKSLGDTFMQNGAR
jgi:LDH2 family malate/lactate/ureidoglycolate dehydrogenase